MAVAVSAVIVPLNRRLGQKADKKKGEPFGSPISFYYVGLLCFYFDAAHRPATAPELILLFIL